MKFSNAPNISQLILRISYVFGETFGDNFSHLHMILDSNCNDRTWSIAENVQMTLTLKFVPKNNFLISQPKHMLWVLKRTVSMRQFF